MERARWGNVPLGGADHRVTVTVTPHRPYPVSMVTCTWMCLCIHYIIMDHIVNMVYYQTAVFDHVWC